MLKPFNDNNTDFSNEFIIHRSVWRILETHAMWECILALGIKPFKDGNQWCFLYGNNIQEGICGFGKTIFDAALNFYTNIKIEEARKEK